MVPIFRNLSLMIWLLTITATPGSANDDEAQDCGGFIVAEARNTVVVSPSGYNEEERICNWTIRAPLRRIVRLEFEYIDLNECCDSVTVSLVELKKVETLTSLPMSIFMSSLGGTISVIFRSTPAPTEKRGFRAIFTAAKIGKPLPPPNVNDTQIADCRYELELDEEPLTITSPNFPAPYSNNLNCVWLINSAERMEIEFETFETEICCDFLTVSGAGEDIQLRGYHAGEVIQSSVGTLQLSFRTDADTVRSGFRAIVRPISAPAIQGIPFSTRPVFNDCGADIIVLKDGDVTSPGYPFRYEAGLDCWWRLETENENDRISIEVESVETENCCDYIELYDGTKLLAKLRGTYRSAPVYSFTSSGNYIRVHFHSDDSVEMKGFSMYFVLERGLPPPGINPTVPESETTVCGETDLMASVDTKTLSSPGWPASEMRTLTCSWMVRAPEMMQIEFIFLQVEILQCCDMIEIEEFLGDESLNTETIKRPTDQIFRSPTGGALRVTYTSFGLMPSRGFKARYSANTAAIDAASTTKMPSTTTEVSVCGETDLTAFADSRTLSSPGWPASEMRRLTCSWVIKAPEMMQIELIFLQVEIQQCCDMIEIEGFLGDEMLSTETIKLLTDRLFRSPTGGTLRVTYTSFGLMPTRGFRARYTARPEEIATPGVSTTPEITTASTTKAFRERPIDCRRRVRRISLGRKYYLQSPKSTTTSCRWTFIAQNRLLVKMTFLEFDVDRSLGTFMIYGTNTTRFEWGKRPDFTLPLYGNQTGFQFVFPNNRGGITYESASITPKFTIVYEAIPGKCGSAESAIRSAREIRTPGFPEFIHEDMLNCTWTITSKTPGREVILTVKDLRISHEDERLVIYDGDKILATLTSDTQEQSFTSSSDSIRVHFVGSDQRTANGFLATFRSGKKLDNLLPTVRPKVCGKILRKIEYGRKYFLQSPDSDVATCRWKLQTTRGLAVRFSFLDFNVDPSLGNFTLVSASKGKFAWETAKELLRLNGNRTGFTYDFRGDTVGVNYNAISREARFTVIYEAYLPYENCGFNVVASPTRRLIGTPGYPNRPYKGRLNCTWTLRQSKNGKQVQLTLRDVRLEHPGDTLMIYDGKNLMTKLSFRESFQPVVTSTEGYIRVVFTSEAHGSEKGFIADYIQVDKPTTPTPVDVTAEPSTATSVKSTTNVEITDAATTAAVTQPPTALRCLSAITSVVGGNVVAINQTSVENCDGDSVCLFVKITASSVVEGLPDPVRSETSYGSCMPKTSTETYGCEQIWATISSSPSMISNVDMDIESCGIQFCETDLCNNGTGITPSTARPISPTPVVESEGLQCYSITKSSVATTGEVAVNNKDKTTCPAGSRCLLANLNSQVSILGMEVAVHVTYGSCFPQEACSVDICSQLPLTFSSMMGMNIKYDQCSASCCEGNLCNDDVIPTLASSTAAVATPEAMTPSPLPGKKSG